MPTDPQVILRALLLGPAFLYAAFGGLFYATARINTADPWLRGTGFGMAVCAVCSFFLWLALDNAIFWENF